MLLRRSANVGLSNISLESHQDIFVVIYDVHLKGSFALCTIWDIKDIYIVDICNDSRLQGPPIRSRCGDLHFQRKAMWICDFHQRFIIESVELLVKSIGVDGTLDCMMVVVIFTALVTGRAVESVGEAVAGWARTTPAMDKIAAVNFMVALTWSIQKIIRKSVWRNRKE